MATTTIQNGTAYKLWVSISGVLTPIAHGKSVSEDSSRSVINVTSQTSGKYTDIMMGRLESVKYSGSFLLKESTAGQGVSYSQLYALYTADVPTAFTLQMGTMVSGDQHTNATVYITSLKKTSGDNEAVTFDATFESTSSFSSATS
jgi:hypothetical protein